MRKVEVVKDNPNAKVVTLQVNEDLMGPYAKISIPRASAVRKYSPFAEKIFGVAADVTRIDFVAEGNQTFVSIARKIFTWNDGNSEVARKMTEDFLKAEPLILLEALGQNFTAGTAFDPTRDGVSGLVHKTFNDHVNPQLAKDGGAMELLNVVVKPTGEIISQIALLGSCHDCGSAQDKTLKAAAEHIRRVLDDVKKKLPDDPTVSRLRFERIEIVNVDQIILSKPADLRHS